MAKLHYPILISKDSKFTHLADLGLNFQNLDKKQIMTNLVDLVPAEFLVLLAEKWSVTGYDGWQLVENDRNRRELIKSATELHRHKGTPWSIKEVIRKLGFGEVEIIEGVMSNRDLTPRYNGRINADGTFLFSEGWRNYYDGKTQYNGEYLYEYSDKNVYRWSHYRVVLKQVITREQANLLREVLRFYAPARCILDGFEYREAALRYNGKIYCDGVYYFGMID